MLSGYNAYIGYSTIGFGYSVIGSCFDSSTIGFCYSVFGSSSNSSLTSSSLSAAAFYSASFSMLSNALFYISISS